MSVAYCTLASVNNLLFRVGWIYMFCHFNWCLFIIRKHVRFGSL